MNPAASEARAQDLCEIEKDPVLRLRRPQDLCIKTLALSNFRNYEYARIEVTPTPVVLTGENGAGKTNILEAISLLTAGRGLRRAKLSEIDKLSSPSPLGRGRGEGYLSANITPHPNPPPQGGRENIAWAIAAKINGKQGEVKIGTGREAPLPASPLQGEENKRIIKIDGKITKSQAELSRHVSMVWLTPQMEQLFGEGASEARKFLDRLVFSFDSEHASRINEYDYAMRERNKLLQMGRGDATWLDALEQTMAETAAATAIARLETCEHINHSISASTLSFPKALVEVCGFVEDLLKAGSSAIEAENFMKKALAENRGQDASMGRTRIGTHRSEFRVTHINKQMLAENCSMGEQKAMMLSIILAQARAGKQWHGVTPIILLDEVVGHLDSIKRSELFAEILDLNAQVWMTGTDAVQFTDLLGKAQFFKVENNSVIPNME